jgi:DNA primase large subunit
MQTTGLCVHRDLLCEKVSHPLSYYKVKKSRPLKPAKPQVADKDLKNS